MKRYCQVYQTTLLTLDPFSDDSYDNLDERVINISTENNEYDTLRLSYEEMVRLRKEEEDKLLQAKEQRRLEEERIRSLQSGREDTLEVSDTEAFSSMNLIEPYSRSI